MKSSQRLTGPDVRRAPPALRWRILGLVGLAQFMVILDITVVNVAMPSIGADLGLGSAGLAWTVAAYTLAFGGFMLLGGRTADLVGRRRTLLAGLVVFMVASLASGLALNGVVLVPARAVQGLGAAFMSPAALAIVTTSFHGEERNRALGVWAGIAAAGSAVGLVVGGLLTTGVGWRWVFFINIPVGVGIAVGVLATVAADRPKVEDKRVDLGGAVSVSLGVGLLVFGFITAGEHGWLTASAGLVGGLALLAIFALIERRHPQPLVSMELVRRRSVASGAVTMLAASGLLIGSIFLTSLLAQRVLGLTSLETGVTFLPAAFAVGAGAHMGGRILARVGPRLVAGIGFGVAAAGLSWLGLIPTDPHVLTDVVPGFVLAFVGLGATLVTATSTGLSDVEQDRAGMASGVVNTSHELGAALGVGLMSALLTAGSAATEALDGYPTAYATAASLAAVMALVAFAVMPKEPIDPDTAIPVH